MASSKDKIRGDSNSAIMAKAVSPEKVLIVDYRRSFCEAYREPCGPSRGVIVRAFYIGEDRDRSCPKLACI